MNTPMAAAPPARESVNARGRGATILFWTVAAMLVFAPVFRGANRPLPLMALELGAVAVLWVALSSRAMRHAVPRELALVLLALFLLPLFYLVPLPWGMWSVLPGRNLDAQVLGLLQARGDLPAWRAASAYPMRTELAWLALLPPLAVFVAVMCLPVVYARRVAVLLLWIAALQAGLGMLQYAGGPQTPLRFGNPWFLDSAVGTYANRNHLAGLLEMSLPLALALAAGKIAGIRRGGRSRPWYQRLNSDVSARSLAACAYGTVALLILLGLILTRSRTGIVLAGVGVVLCAMLFTRRLGRHGLGLVGAVSMGAISLAAVAGLGPVLHRFAAQDPLSDVRWALFSSSLEGIGRFFPVGSGPGSFPYAFAPFQPRHIPQFVNHAHNDYLEWLLEGGMAAGIVMALLLWLYLRRWPRLWRAGGGNSFHFAQLGAGIGVGAMLLHGLTDFNLHIPANAVFFAVLAALFFHPAPPRQESGGARRRRRAAGLR